MVIHECGLKKGLKKGPSAVGSYLSSSLEKIIPRVPIMQGQALWEWFSMAGTRMLAVGPRPFYHPVPAQLPARPEKPNFTRFQ